MKQDPVKLVVSNFSMSSEREEQIDFAGPYFVDMQAFLSRDSTITTISEVLKSRVCVVEGSSSDQKLGQIGGNNRVRNVSLAACMAEYHAGRVDVISHDRSLIAGLAKDMRPRPPLISTTFGAERYGVAMPDKMPRLCNAISEIIDKFLKYEWSDSFQAHLAPLGLQESDYTPPTLESCDSAVPWYR